MTEPLLAAVAAVLVAIIGATAGGSWLNRRNLAKLTAAQAEAEDANAAEVTDRIAREWLEDLRGEVLFHKSEVTALEREVRIERRVRRIALDYAARLRDWAATVTDHEPPAMPADLADFLEA